ncbi:hypothetical protein P8452_27760 [Trifolium repens]|nr:hypothetical protein P8452_27760 [Trifolium repens]
MPSAEEHAIAELSSTVRAGGELVLLGPVQNKTPRLKHSYKDKARSQKRPPNLVSTRKIKTTQKLQKKKSWNIENATARPAETKHKVTTSIDLISWLSNAKHTFIYTYTPKSLTPFIKEKKEKNYVKQKNVKRAMDG